MRMLDHHMQQNRLQGQVVASTPAISKNMRERQKKPSADVEMTEAKWRDSRGENVIGVVVAKAGDIFMVDIGG